jgi:hypothetical protein
LRTSALCSPLFIRLTEKVLAPQPVHTVEAAAC